MPPARGKLNEPIIVIEDLVKRFGDSTAVDNLSLKIFEGELFGLLGPNGAGKTTTINVLCGLFKPTGGKVLVDGFDVQKETSKVKSLIGVCPQDTAVFKYLTGRENVELFGSLYGLPKEKLRRNASTLLNRLGFNGYADVLTSKYSGGMKRRLSLIMALVHDPEIAFLDEPTVGMDPQSRHAVWTFLRELKGHGKTIILTTHYMEEAENLCDRIGIVDHGKLIAVGALDELKEQYGVNCLEDVFMQLTGRKIRDEM